MFQPWERDPFSTFTTEDWKHLRELLSHEETCLPQFAIEIKLAFPCINEQTFAKGTWGHNDENLLLASTVLEPVGWETNSHTSRPACRIHYIRSPLAMDLPNLLVCTDPPFHREHRVFPWSDEARALLGMMSTIDIPAPRRVLNAFCGPGTLALCAAQAWPTAHVVGTDINARALTFGRFNTLLNGPDQVGSITWTQADLLDYEDAPFDLIIGLPPFALQPPSEVETEYVHSAGGETGQRVVARLMSHAHEQLEPSGTLLFLTYALGNGNTNEPPKALIPMIEATRHFGEWTVIHLEREKVWRVGDHKRFKNPMPIRYMVSRLADPTYRSGSAETFDVWQDWIEDELIGKGGFTHLHYVAVMFKKAGAATA